MTVDAKKLLAVMPCNTKLNFMNFTFFNLRINNFFITKIYYFVSVLASLSDISASLVTNSSEITDVTTQFEARIVGLPFGRDVFVTQYTVIISRNDTAFATNQNPIQYPG